MVEEMMLLANITVAQHTLAAFAACTLLRRHAVPPPRQFEPLLRAATAAGFTIDISTSKVCPCTLCSPLHRSLAQNLLKTCLEVTLKMQHCDEDVPHQLAPIASLHGHNRSDEGQREHNYNCMIACLEHAQQGWLSREPIVSSTAASQHTCKQQMSNMQTQACS